MEGVAGNRQRTMNSKMLNLLTALFTASCLLLPTQGALFNFKSFSRTKDPYYSCPNYPLPTADPSRLASELQSFLSQITDEVNSTLHDYKSPGAVAIGLVYNQNLLWTKGFGFKNGKGIIRSIFFNYYFFFLFFFLF